MPHPRRSLIGKVIAGLIVVAIAFLFGIMYIEGIFWNKGHQLTTLSPKGNASDSIQQLVQPVFAIAAVVFVGVLGMVLFIAIKFRDKGDNDEFPPQVHGRTALEIGWTLLPALILAGVAVATVITILNLEKTSPDALKVQVTGQQWWWSYHYDTNNDGTYTDTSKGDIITATELVIPVGKEVDLSITSNDVIHSFWIPALNGKKDAVPGQDHPLKLESNEIGVYRGQCTEFCGLSHANMRMIVRVVSQSDYDAWVRNQQTPAAPLADNGSQASEGYKDWNNLCSGCHLINGINNAKLAATPPPLVSGVAPDLTHLMTRGTFAGSIFNLYTPQDPSNPSQPGDANDVSEPGDPGGALIGGPSAPFTVNAPALAAWLRNPPAMKPAYAQGGRGMPNLGLSEIQINQLVAYLETLH
jgi:cytochrome c oxidase subunit 2